jgi:hypothetical protein
MTSFIRIDDDTYISLAAVRSIRRCWSAELHSGFGQVEIEFSDGTKRSYTVDIDYFNFTNPLDALVGQIVPAAPGWQMAKCFRGEVSYLGVIAFRIKPNGIIEPITNDFFYSDLSALVDPQGGFIDLDELAEYKNETEFVMAAKEHIEQLKAEADDEAAQQVGG